MREFLSGTVEVGSEEPTLICIVPQDIQFATVKNIGDETVYFGGPQVNSGADDGVGVGFPLNPGESHDIPCYDSDSIELYAISATDTVGSVAYLVSSGS